MSWKQVVRLHTVRQIARWPSAPQTVARETGQGSGLISSRFSLGRPKSFGGVATCVTHKRGGTEAKPNPGMGYIPGRMRAVLKGGPREVFRWLRRRWGGYGCCQYFSRRISARSHPAKVAEVFRAKRYQRRNPSSPLAIERVLYVPGNLLDYHFLSASHLWA